MALKRIGLLTSGGDAPGMNACIRAAVHEAEAQGIEIVAFKRGYAGLVVRISSMRKAKKKGWLTFINTNVTA